MQWTRADHNEKKEFICNEGNFTFVVISTIYFKVCTDLFIEFSNNEILAIQFISSYGMLNKEVC